jgi:exo-beta-1,3-glucanase (GH17 family)
MPGPVPHPVQGRGWEHHGGKPLTITDSSVPGATKVLEVIVYVNHNGVLLFTDTEPVILIPPSTTLTESSTPGMGDAQSTSTQALPISPLTSEASSTESATVSAAPFDTRPAEPESTPPPASQDNPPPVSPLNQNPPRGLHGISYSPYKMSSGQAACKTIREVRDDLSAIAGAYSMIRLYGTDCDQVAKAYPVAKDINATLFLGVYDLSFLEDEVSAIVGGIEGDWAVVDTVSVGNEMVHDHRATVKEVLGAVDKFRALLRAAGYHGPVVTVDAIDAIQMNPELCGEGSDYCAFNAHPFFDGDVTPNHAGEFLLDMIAAVRGQLSNPRKRVVVSETGWPWRGATNQLATPIFDSQDTAISSIKRAFKNNPQDFILFSAYNDLWKKAEKQTFIAEQWWGIGGAYSAAGDRW